MLTRGTYTDTEHARAVTVAEIRDRNGYGRRDRIGYHVDGAHLDGALSELAVSKATGLPWNTGLDGPNHRGDVGGLEVRSTRHAHGHLIVKDCDDPARAYVLVTLDRNVWHIRGWCYGHEGRDLGTRQSYGGAPPAWFIPQGALHGPESIPC